MAIQKYNGMNVNGTVMSVTFAKSKYQRKSPPIPFVEPKQPKVPAYQAPSTIKLYVDNVPSKFPLLELFTGATFVCVSKHSAHYAFVHFANKQDAENA
jgi:hypothetical protein